MARFDNASFHKSDKTKGLIESVRCKVLFLPPYLSDLNPIEKFWFAIKHAIKKALPSFWPDINSAIDFVFQYSGNPFLG
ncbi:transposase [Wolbachia endosymbiont (group A) of Myopa testacea]|uniref:transposase n=1 Tax=Wolbachia endosymbiont (group A) of Myopa testacea TaxID=3066148 RepID=UPI00397C3436